VRVMVDHRLEVVEVPSLARARELLLGMGCDPGGVAIMAPKAVLRVVRCHDVVLQDAVFVKQDMLSVGGEVAIPRYTYERMTETADVLVFGTVAQLEELVGKLRRHYPRVRALADELARVVAGFR
jgi:dihydropteroate synthase